MSGPGTAQQKVMDQRHSVGTTEKFDFGGIFSPTNKNNSGHNHWTMRKIREKSWARLRLRKSNGTLK